MTDPTLEPGEKTLRSVSPDRGIFWRDHAVQAALGAVAALVILALLGNPHLWVGPVAAVAALGLRGAYIARETLAQRWTLTDRRLIGPSGNAIMLLEIETVRRLLGDVQIITKAGDKYLIKHVADAQSFVAAVEDARTRRARRVRD